MTAEQLWKIEVMVARWKLAAWRERRAALRENASTITALGQLAATLGRDHPDYAHACAARRAAFTARTALIEGRY
ncbi:hypothetical protein ACFSR9_08760 [Deinococcus taklimakanensis]|uniref:Uncharacterized protein n=1 Tax=Deinococcus taklimakanensis TaxID=536443 RepID=A0ABW5P3T6_9DEIO